MIDWTLTRVATGESRSLEDWGIRTAIRTLVNQGRDTLVLSFAGNDLLGNSPFDPAEILRLDRVDTGVATTVFIGHIVSEVRAAYGSNEGLSVTLAGPWWYLEKIVYTQPANFATDTSAPFVTDPADYPLAVQQTAQILFGNDQVGARVDSRFMVIEAINFAIAKGAPLQYGVIDPGISVPREDITDVTLAEIILRSLKWTPGQSAWFDYTTDPPTLNIMERANRTLLPIDVNALEIDQVELNPRLDLVISGVTVNYIRRHQRFIIQSPGANFTLLPLEVLTLDPEQAGPDPAGIGALVLSMELYGSTEYQTGTDYPPTFDLVAQEDAPVGIAAALYASYSALQFEGRISLVRDDCDATPWIGQTVQVLNGNPAWLGRLMDVRQAADNIFSGRTELTIGPSLQLGPTDLLNLLRKGKTIPPLRGNILLRVAPSPVPTIPPTPPAPIPILHVPPAPPPHHPPEGTHVDVDPFTYVTSNLQRSGTFHSDTAHIAWPPGGIFSPAWIALPAGEPPYPILIVGATVISASLDKTGKRTAGGGVTYYWETVDLAGDYTETTFNFTQFSTGTEPGMAYNNVLSLWLIGTQTKSKADGTNETTPFSIEISAGIGGRPTYRAIAAVGATHNWDDSISFQVAEASGSIALTTLRIFTR